MANLSGAAMCHLWVFSLSLAEKQRAGAIRHCSPEDHEQVNSFRSALDRDRALICRGTLRAILCGYVEASPHEMVFLIGPNGKPSLPAGLNGPYFNVSHSEGLAAIAVSPDCDVGVDIEAWQAVEKDIAESFAPSESAFLEQLAGRDWVDAFYRCWTRKEAVLKALGDGLVTPLDSFAVPMDTRVGPLPLRQAPSASCWQDLRLFPFEPAPGFSGAICLASGSRPVVVKEIRVADRFWR